MSRLNYQILYSSALGLLLETQANGRITKKDGCFESIGYFENSTNEIFEMMVLVETVPGHSYLKSNIGRLIDQKKLEVAAITAIHAIQSIKSKPDGAVSLRFPFQLFKDYVGGTYMLSIAMHAYDAY